MNDVEKTIASCDACKGSGMVEGERCTTCNGQGFTRTALTDEAAAVTLADLKKDELVALAEARGLDASGTKADIIERLEAQPDAAPAEA